ncbi:sodium-dependent phosphate transport protein 2B [Aplysia californica]|uniref:Sodium-dependent phosphate transport protein 2B n=1 Tax=Aplysia californica TaxID=6500 RepID=A0ABM1A8X3_APLCA|nr:sodium-dependent phosphate transport protein 2B [Aplysia californica]
MDSKGYYDDNGTYTPPAIEANEKKNGKINDGFVLDEKPVDKGDVILDRIGDDEEEDPWKVTSLSQNYTPWNELSQNGKILRVIGYFVKVILVLAALYMFICSLDFLSSAFKLLGGEAAGKVFQQNDILSNPVAGLMMGVLVTVLVQSSSTSTSIVVSMVGAGILKIKTAIPIIMGANIGTSVTNTIVAIGQISDKGEFRRAFAGATVHDMFNWLSVIVLLPIEIATGYLYHLSGVIVDSLPLNREGDKSAKKDILKVITKPFTSLIIQVNKDAIKQIANNKDPEFDESHAIMKVCCDKTTPSKCCSSKLKSLASSPAFSFLNTDSTYSTSHKLSVCQNEELRSCAKRDGPDAIATPGNCTDAWAYSNVTRSKTMEWLDCSMFNGATTETNSCNTFLNTLGSLTPGSVNHSDACLRIQPKFTSQDHTFSLQNCTSSWVNKTVEYTAMTDEMSCTRWAKHVEQKTCNKECEFLFKGLYPTLNDKEIGGILLVISLVILSVCLVCMVKLLHSLLRGPMAVIIKKFVNADFPGPLGYLTGYLAILIGAGLTIVVQSSSIFTSTLTPLVGIGVIELDRMYPLTLGSNIGTTTTAVLSALANSGDKLLDSLQVAFCHLFFNITGILLFYPLPFMRFPIPLAKFLGNRTANYRWYAIVYIFVMFFIFPGAVFALSLPGWYVLAGVMGPIFLLFIIVAIIKVIQAKAPQILPTKLQNWKFLPKALRSLEPYDRVMMKIFFCKRFQMQKQQPNSPMSPSYVKNTRF